MSIKIAINGFGRIGRVVFRQIYEAGLEDQMEVVAINDLADPETLVHLLQYDSVHRHFKIPLSTTDSGISIHGRDIQMYSERNPSDLPWGALGIDLVMECTGIFRKREEASQHLSAGAKRVLISAPSPDPDAMIVHGVNSNALSSDVQILSAGSCTTNCLAPIAKVIHENFGITHGTMTTIHSYTNDQRILDLPHKDLRRTRAAALSMIPTTTGAARAIGTVLPELNGKIDGFAIRVPTPNVSLVDFVVQTQKSTTVESVNAALKQAAEGSLKGVLGFSEEPLVSIDYLGNTHSSIIDGLSTLAIGENLIKIISWYDNEVGFSCRMIDIATALGEL